MRVLPVESLVFLGNNLPKKDTEDEESKSGVVEDINPSFKYYMKNCQPIKPQLSFKGFWKPQFTGHWPQYSTDSVIFDTIGMPFPMTVIPTDTTKPGQLNILA